MSSLVPTIPKVSAVRTFADDLAAARQSSGTAPKKISAKPAIKQTPAPLTKTVVIPPKPPVVLVKVPAPTETTVIPPFHTFSKPVVKPATVAVTTIDTSAFKSDSRPKNISTLDDPSIGVTIGDAAKTENIATVLTDKKYKRFSLFQLLSQGIFSWLQSIKENLTTTKKPKYTIPEADRRKGVIQRATSQTGRTTTADHAEVLKRLRSARTTPIATVPPIPKALPHEVIWETAVPVVVTMPIIPVVLPEVAPRVVTRPLIVPTIPEIKNIPPEPESAIVLTPIDSVTPLTRAQITPMVPGKATTTSNELSYQSVRNIRTDIPSVVTTPLLTALKPFTSLTPVSDEVTTSRPGQVGIRSWFLNTRGLILLSSFGSAIIILAVGGFLYFKSNVPPTPIVTLPVATTAGATSTPTLLVNTQAEIIAALSRGEGDDISLAEITLLSRQTGALLTAREFFTAFEISLPVSFTAAINQLRVGTYRGQPWILLIISDTPTGQGGMFIWEQTIHSDLQPWFSPTNYQITRSVFSDSIIDNRDVRIIKNISGEYLMTYGFLNQNAILITTNDTAWLNLGQKLNGGL